MNDDKQAIGRYVYCIIKNPGEMKNFGTLGFGEEEVYTMKYRDFAPVFSNASMKDYEVDEKDVEIHKNVVRQVMKEHSVIPVAYGMAFKKKKMIQIAMKVGYKAIKKT